MILGGTLTEYASWRWCLLINVPIAIVAFIAGTILITESKSGGGSSYDIPGAILGTAGLVALVYGFTQAAKTGVGWLSVQAISCFVSAGILLVAFVLVELRSASPLLPMRVVLERNRGGSYLASLLVFAGLFAMFLFLSYYFQYNLGYSALKSGIAFLPFSAGIIVTSAVVSGLLPRTGPKPLMLIGLAMVATGLATFTRISDTSSWVSTVLPGELLMSVGLALVIVPLSNLALTGVNKDDAGVASAVLNSAGRRIPGHGAAEHLPCECGRLLSRGPSPPTVRVQPARRDPRLSRRVLDRGRADRRGVRGRSGPGHGRQGHLHAARYTSGRLARIGRPPAFAVHAPPRLSQLVAAAGQVGNLGGVAGQLDGFVVGRA